MLRKRVPWSLVAGVAIVGAGAAYAASPGPLIMGKATTLGREAFHGYYDGHKDTYLNTDVSDKAQAKAMHVNYAPVLGSVPLATAPEIYLVDGRAAIGQLAVFGSEPGETTYSPVWKETMLMWKPDATAVLITSDTQIDALEKRGVLTEKATRIRLNCPIVKVGKSV